MKLPARDLIHVVEHVHGWEQFRRQRIFLTGASGFVGRWLTESFEYANAQLRLGAELVAVRRDSLPNGRFAFGIHAAKADSYWADMLGTQRILEFAVAAGVKRFLFTSSGAVYGKRTAEMREVTEDFAGAPYTHDANSGYAQAKRCGEFLCAEYAARFGLDCITGRLFSFCGPALPLDLNFAVGNFVRDVLAGGPVVVQGDGTAQRSYLYSADLAVWLWTLLLAGESGQPYNVGSPESISIGDLAELVVAQTRPGTQIVWMGGGESSVYVPSVERAQANLSLRPLISLGEGIRRMYEWNRNAKGGETSLAQPTTS